MSNNTPEAMTKQQSYCKKIEKNFKKKVNDRKRYYE